MTNTQTLKTYNEWRRGADIPQPNPTDIGVAIDGVLSELEHLQKENEKLKAAVNAVVDLIDSSTGVSGLHQNGDVADWDSILAGGHFEEWLIDLSEAINADYANKLKGGE